MRSTGLILAAGGVAVANDVLFAPVARDPKGLIDSNAFTARFNWRILPATAVLALTIGALEKAAPDFAVGLAGLTLLTVLLVPMGTGDRSAIENVVSFLGY